MLLFGHRFIEADSFYHINTIDAIKKTAPNSYLYLTFSEENLDIITHMRENMLTFALEVTTIQELIYASALKASFIFVNKELVKTAQNIAENYLFDAKIVLKISDEEEIEEAALLGVDGVYFSSAIIKVTS